MTSEERLALELRDRFKNRFKNQNESVFHAHQTLRGNPDYDALSIEEKYNACKAWVRLHGGKEQKMIPGQTNELAAALSKAQDELEGAKKQGNNPAFRSKYARLDGVWEAWQEVGPKHGLSIVQLVEDAGEGRQGIVLRTILMHASGQQIEAKSFWPATKNDAQGFGSALTYARRYTLMALTGICPVDDDDGNAAVASTKAQAASDVERFETGLKKCWDDKVKLATVLAEANKAGLSDIAKRAHARIQELGNGSGG